MHAGDADRAVVDLPADRTEALLDVARATASCRDLRGLLLRDLFDVLSRVTSFDRVAIVLQGPVADVMRLDMVAALDETMGWSLDADAMEAIDAMVREHVSDPVGPEFMAPPARTDRRLAGVARRTG
jgi:hypothetical protein